MTKSLRPSCGAVLALLPLLSTLAAAPALAQSSGASTAAAGYLQYGGAGSDTRALNAGVTWPWQRSWQLFGGRVGGYWDLSVGRWESDNANGTGGDGHANVLAFTPTFRWRPNDGASPWFVDAGIGATLISPRYRRNGETFSTVFNFGDQIGIGRSFGAQGRHELALRAAHYSNAGIKHPNPGINFWQLRYSVRFE